MRYLTRRSVLLWLPSLLLISSIAAAQERPNIIVIMADDLGWGDLGCYGHEQLKTPNIDRLAAEGTLFTQFYANGSISSPTRCALMTGQFPGRNAVHAHFAGARENAERGMPNWLDPRVPTVTSILERAGYWTAHFGRWHLGGGRGAPSPVAYGIRTSRTVTSTGASWEPEERFRAKSSALIIDETLRLIRDHREEPFYVNAWMLVPHGPLDPTDEQLRAYDRYSWGQGAKYKSAATVYYATVADLDAQLGLLLDELDRLELTDNTLVIFTSSNGPEDIHVRNAGHSGIGSTGPFRGRKRSLYEGGIRVPFIARWPGHVPAGRIDDNSVISTVDLLPTFCQLAQVPIPDLNLDGEDVSEILLGRDRARTRPLMWQWRFRVFGEPLDRSPMLAIRSENWKLLMNPDRSRVELYDIPNDPSELKNLSDQQPEIVDRLAEQLLAFSNSLPEGPIAPEAGRNDYPWPGTTPSQSP